MFPEDNEALEGKRKCDFAIENRIKFEKIRTYMARGIEYFDKKDYGAARMEFERGAQDGPEAPRGHGLHGKDRR